MMFLGKLIKQKCDNSEYLCKALCPVLIIHGMKVASSNQDDLIPFTDILAMYNALQSKRISLVITPELEHNCYDEYTDLYQPMQEYYGTVFPLDRVIDSSLTQGKASYRFSRVSLLH